MFDLLPNCWEIINCGREKNGLNEAEKGECIVSKSGMGHSCWAVAGTYSGKEVQCVAVKEVIFCSSCRVHRQYNRSTGVMGEAVRVYHPLEHLQYNTLLIERARGKEYVSEKDPA